MSNSGYRGRNFGPRGARINGPGNGFNGPRFSHPSFNHARLPHRLPGPEKWIEHSNYTSWQQNKTFHPHPQYRDNLQFRPSNRGRAVGSRGIIRFSGLGRPPVPKFCMGFIRNPIHRALLPQEEQVEDKPTLIQTPLLGSEEERQQKISETADKLKQKLSSITEEELTNFWEDDLSVLPSNCSEEDNTQNKGIPELRHEPPELNLTFTDFKDIGRVDCSNSKFENVDNKSNNDISITFEKKVTDNIISTIDEITIIHENKREPLIVLDSTHDKSDLNQSIVLLENDKCHKKKHQELSDFECNVEGLQLPDGITENLIPSALDNINKKSLTLNLTNLLPIDSVNDITSEKSSNVNNIEIASISASTVTDQDELQIDFSQDQNSVQINIQDANRSIIQDVNVDVQHNEYTPTKLEDNQIQDSVQTNVCHETFYQNLVNMSDSSQNSSFNTLPFNEKIHSNASCDSMHPGYLNEGYYNEVHKVNTDKKLNNPLVSQSRVFNIPPRFTMRVGGPRCHWTFQNGKNLFFRGSQRLPFHGNQIPPSRHIVSFKSTDLVPVGFSPRAPPPFLHNVPISSHDSQHNVLVPFVSNDLPPTFDPSEPPPNIRLKPVTESSNLQENMQSVVSLDSSNQAISTSQSNLKIIQPPPAFDPREPPPRITNISVAVNEKLPEFNPQQPPPRIYKKEKSLQPPPIFDPRLSSQERSSLITPLDTSRSNMMSLNLMETSSLSDFNIGSVTSNFSQLPPMNIPSPQPFISNVQMNFQPALSDTNGRQGIMREFSLPPPPMSITEVPPPLPKEPSMEGNLNSNQNINMDDGLEDMQEAMEFAKQIMNMTEEVKKENALSALSELPSRPLEIPVPNETVSHSLSTEEERTSIVKKQKRKENKNKRSGENVVCGPELILERQEEIETIDKEQSVQSQNKNTEDALLSNDQIRPKVVFNLNSKAKKIHKPEEWHRIPVNISENKETSQQSITQNSNKQRIHFIECKRSNANQNKNHQKECNAKKNLAHSASITNTPMYEKLSDISYHKNYTKDSEQLQPNSPNTKVANNLNIQKCHKSKEEASKEKVPTSESSWKNRVISRFLKMSKNDICNMVNNSSLRKFDIAMKHLVKERRSSISLKMRNTEDEKMKEYDREEFMNQLNAMLDPSAVVGITDLPTEFIHHLSEVLQLDSMPFDTELSETPNADVDEVTIINQDKISRVCIPEYSHKENLRVKSFSEYSGQDTCREHTEDQLLYNKEESTHYSLTTELDLNVSREDTNSSFRSLSTKVNSEIESTHKKHQQPLFNEADLDDILSEVTERTKNLPTATSTSESEKSTETRTGLSLTQTVTESFGYNTFSQIPNKTAADLDDIFSAGIARVKLLSKSNADLDDSRTRKSNSEERNTLGSKRYERWNRKERDDPDAFRNLTKEEWEAKYGSTNATIAPTVMWKSISNSTENLSKDSRNNHAQRYCSSDSPMRRLSISPLIYETSTNNLDRCVTHPCEIEELRRIEQSESSGDSSSSSSSDSDEEIVAPNVTKLLKVIKEKEKIAKKRSLNETIRDEVTAEIEKKWKEKSKHKERKSRKREKRKKDKREKRKKEKKTKRKRNSYSDSSKYAEQTIEFRLLTEDEIKKEVIIKEEPVSSFEGNISFNNGISNACVVPNSTNKTVDIQIESQSSQIEKEQQVPTIVCDAVSSQTENRSAIILMMTQPKTKAQLKQMPESGNIEQKQFTKKTVEISENGTVYGNNEKMRDILDMNKDNEIAMSNDKPVSTTSPINISLQQTNISLSVTKELCSSIQPRIEAVRENDTTHTTSLTCSTLNPVVEVNTNNQHANQKVLTSTFSTENKSGGYKKIDIKAYKERALQRRLREQAVLKENPESSALLLQDHNLHINKSNIESLSTVNEIKTADTDMSLMQSKDPRLTKARSNCAPSEEDSDKEVTEKAVFEEEQQSMNVVQKDKELLTSAEVTSANEKNNVTGQEDSNLHILKEHVKHKEHKNDNKLPLEQIITVESSVKEKPKLTSEEKKLKKLISTVDLPKFKYIRSEGSKELKLKKEKAKRFNEQKKKDSKTSEPKCSIAGKYVEKFSHKKVFEDKEDSLSASNDTIIKTETEKTRDHDKEHSETCSNDQESIDAHRKLIDVDKNIKFQVNEIPCSLQIVNLETIKTDNGKSLINLGRRKDGIKETENHTTESTEINVTLEFTSNENMNKQKDVYKDVSSVGLSSVDRIQAISIEQCVEGAVSPVSVCVDKKSRSLSEHINVDVERNSNSININDSRNVETHVNSILETKMDSKFIGNDPTQSQKRLQNLDDHDEVIENEAKSPDSPTSPFKGFLMDSINDVCQVSQLCDNDIKMKSDKEECLQENRGNKEGGRYSFTTAKENNEATLICNSVESQENVTNTVIDLSDNIEVGSVLTETQGRATKKNDDTFNVPPDQEKTLSTVGTDSCDTFEEGSEPFIVLDEYIDDTDGRSMENLNALDLDLEDCIARNADIFTNKSMRKEGNSTSDMKSPNFNSIDFEDLPEVFDKNNVNREQSRSSLAPTNENEESTLSEENNVPPKQFASEERSVNTTDVISSTSEPNVESSSKISETVQTTDSIVSEHLTECFQYVINPTEKSTISELSVEESSRTEKENYCCNNMPENNLQRKPCATKSMLENFPIATPTSEVNIESVELNKQQELSNTFRDKEMLSSSSKVRTSGDKDAFIDETMELETLEDSNKTIVNKANRREENGVLHKIKSKSKMKCKKQKRNISESMIKEVIKSDSVKVKSPNTKESIMARMIEIDVEIHKLMTEKMTLYQMLTNDYSASDKNSQENNINYENKEAETQVIRSRTPSALMSQLIQNIETSPVKNQCVKTTAESSSTKDDPSNSEQSDKSRTLSKYEHCEQRKENCTFTCDSDQENVHNIEDINSSISRKRKRRSFEKAMKKLEKDTESLVTEKIQASDTSKLISRKINMKQTITEQESSQVSVNETEPQENINRIYTQQIDEKDLTNSDKVKIFKYQEAEKMIELVEPQVSTEEIVRTRIIGFGEESGLTKDNQERTDSLSEKNIDTNSSEKPHENRTSERSSIYSDDSTWESFLQNSSIDEQKKPNTGLALLEETYKKEIAKARKMKAAARKRKKKKLQNLLETLNTLTPDEEELPLSALYIKKYHQRKRLLSSLEQQTKPQTDDDPQLWKNVVEVINAVAENRADDLCIEPLRRQTIGKTEQIISDVLELKENLELKQYKEEQMVVDSFILKNTKKLYIEPSIDVQISCENKDYINNDHKTSDLIHVSSKSQEFLCNEHFQQNLEVSESSKISNDLSERILCDTSTNIEKNVEHPVQRTVKNDNVDVNQLMLTGDSNLYLTEINSSYVHNERHISNTSHLNSSDSDEIKKRIDMENEKLNLQAKVVDIEKNAETQKSINNQTVTTFDNVKKGYCISIGFNNDKNSIPTNEITSKENSEFKVEYVNKEMFLESLVPYEDINNTNNDTKELNYAFQNEHFISLKEHKESNNKKEIEQFIKVSSEENNNQNCTSVSSGSENMEIFKSDETLSKKSYKRRRESNKSSLRRSSRYVEESVKHIKLEVDVNPLNTELEVQDKNLKIYFPHMPSTSLSCDETETVYINSKRNRIQKPIISRKRCTPTTSEIEILYANDESLKAIKKYKQHTMSEMMNCVVRVEDCKHTILDANVNPNVLQKYGISKINTYMYSNSTYVDSFVSAMQPTSTKDLSAVHIEQTPLLTEYPQSQTPKLIKKFDDTMRPVSDQIDLTKVRKMLKPTKVDSALDNKEECIDPDIEVMPVLIKESVTVDITQNCEKPDIEIVEEKMIVTKNLQHSNSGSTLIMIDAKDDKELPRTQYTVHKGPILDIKVFENSFLAASEDGRIYRYNQASNGILNIYKGHKGAVTCLYVYNTNNTDFNKEWMFSGSLDGTLRCYNIITGVQVRDTADVGSAIQCMDEAWGIIFIGTKSGHVTRYHVKSGIIKGNTIQFSDKSVLALKATNEGPRRVLIVASRSQPITIRDAQSGLFLRTICGQKSHTVYSLMRDNNLIYCGTSSTSIPVFDFTTGEQTMQYDAGVGIVCMRLYKQLLFAGCYDGNIYVFDTKDHQLVCSIPGPGNMLLSMEVIDNKIIAGSKDKRLQSWQMPCQVRSLL